MSLEPGLYRILAPIDSANSLGYVATSGDNVGDPVTLALSKPKNLHELWVVRELLLEPGPSVYTLENIGQRELAFAKDKPLLPEGIVVTAEKPDTYLIESGFDNNNGIYVIYTTRGAARSQAWTAGNPGSPITIQGADPVKPPQTWQFVPVLKD